jgi:hypothetical protein
MKRAEAELRNLAASAKRAAKETAKQAKASKKNPTAGRAIRVPSKAGSFMSVTKEDLKTFKNEELAKEFSSTGGTLVPPHRHDVHIKKQTITIVVTLHNVPPQKIDADATTDSCLVVATPGHTRHYHLKFPFPDGMRVDSSKGDYTYENGELKCVFPVTKMPAEVVRKWNDRLESVRKAQKARFEIAKDGTLEVRRRKTTLELQQIAQKKKAAAVVAAAVPAEPAAPEQPVAVSSGPVPPSIAEEKSKMLEIARGAAKKVAAVAKARLATAQAAHVRRIGKAKTTAAKKETKAERMAVAFSRVLEEKRKALEARKSRIDPVAAAKPKTDTATPRKSVSFKA